MRAGPGSGKGGSEEGGANQNEGMDDAGEEVEGQDDGAGGGADKGNRPGAKPQLRVYIPGQKEFVPRTVSDLVTNVIHTVSIYACTCTLYLAFMCT